MTSTAAPGTVLADCQGVAVPLDRAASLTATAIALFVAGEALTISGGGVALAAGVVALVAFVVVGAAELLQPHALE